MLVSMILYLIYINLLSIYLLVAIINKKIVQLFGLIFN